MLITARHWAGFTVLALFLFACDGTPVQPALREGGREWLSWSPAERNRYVIGFLDGYGIARHNSCVAADELFEVGQPHRMGDDQHPTDYPSGRCLAGVDEYSRFKYTPTSLDISAYVTPITQFYAKHPEHQDILVSSLMESLSDKQSRTAEELLHLAVVRKLHAPE